MTCAEAAAPARDTGLRRLDTVTTEQAKHAAREISPWMWRFLGQPREAFRQGLLSASTAGLGVTFIAFGDCLAPLFESDDLLFYEPDARPCAGDLLFLLWGERQRAALSKITPRYAATGVKVLAIVDGHPWLVCRYGIVAMREDDQILGVVRALRRPTAIDRSSGVVQWLEPADTVIGDGLRS